MMRPRFTVADVVRSCLDEFLEKYGSRLTPEQYRLLIDLTSCRTAALGGHILECPDCGYQQIAYNSCGNRHCPTCQATAAARWLEARAAELLPVPYFHAVFTLPDALDPIALANPRMHLRPAACGPPPRPSSRWPSIPSTWELRSACWQCSTPGGRPCMFHPHVHCVVTGGGPSPDETCWIGCPEHFFLPKKILSRVFRGKFLAGLRAAFTRRDSASGPDSIPRPRGPNLSDWYRCRSGPIGWCTSSPHSAVRNRC